MAPLCRGLAPLHCCVMSHPYYHLFCCFDARASAALTTRSNCGASNVAAYVRRLRRRRDIVALSIAAPRRTSFCITYISRHAFWRPSACVRPAATTSQSTHRLLTLSHLAHGILMSCVISRWRVQITRSGLIALRVLSIVAK